MFCRNHIITNVQIRNCRRFIASALILRTKKNLSDFSENEREPSRMKQFHEKLKLHPIQNLMLTESDPGTGEPITNNEKDPTKWGDWQNGGRVSDF